jgi:hypothetical protein
VGSNLKIVPTVHQSNSPPLVLDQKGLQICTAPCTKDDEWKENATIVGGSAWIASNTFAYRLRNRMSQDNVPFGGRVILISQSAFWSFWGTVLLVGASSGLIALAGKNDSKGSHLARKILFRLVPDVGPASWLNQPLFIATAFDVGLWWFVRPMLLQISQKSVENSGADGAVATATVEKRADETALVIYECLHDESVERAASICKIISTSSLLRNQAWRLPLMVRLEEQPDGDIKKALIQRLQSFGLDNSTFAERLIRSRRIIFVFLGSEELKDKVPVPAVLQAARGQASRSVIVTAAVPAWVPSGISINIQSVRTAASRNLEA